MNYRDPIHYIPLHTPGSRDALRAAQERQRARQEADAYRTGHNTQGDASDAAQGRASNDLWVAGRRYCCIVAANLTGTPSAVDDEHNFVMAIDAEETASRIRAARSVLVLLLLVCVVVAALIWRNSSAGRDRWQDVSGRVESSVSRGIDRIGGMGR